MIIGNIKTRIEKDSMGEVLIDANKLWGAQTQRSLNNFKIGDRHELMPIEIIRALAYLKKACATANVKCKILSEEKSHLIGMVCDEILSGVWDEQFPLIIWQTGSGTQTNMNLNEVIANRAIQLSPTLLHPNDDVNKSQSSNDTFSSAMHIATYILTKEVTLPGLKKLLATLESKSRDFNNIVKVGRTHMMDATPITLGQEISGHGAQLKYAIKCIKSTLETLAEIPIGGSAVGNGINVPQNFDSLVCEQLSKFTGHQFQVSDNKFSLMAGADTFVALSGSFKVAAAALMKMANDIRLLSSGPRAGLGEITFAENEPGSSIMPGKVNPTQVEALTMVCAQIIGNDAAIMVGGLSGQLELNVFRPMIAANILRSARLLGDVCVSFSDNCAQSIVPNRKHIKEQLENSLMLVTALNPIIGYEKAALIAKKAHKENITLKVSATQLGFLTEEEFNIYVDPTKMV